MTSIAVTSVFCMCELNVYALQLLVQGGAKSSVGVGLTFLQFLFIALVSFFFVFDFQRLRFKRFRLRAKDLRILVAVFALISVLNILAASFKVSVPINTVFRSSGLMSGVAVGSLFFGMRYSMYQLASAFLVTLGMTALVVLPEAGSGYEEGLGAEDRGPSAYLWWLGGILILAATVALGSGLALFQARCYKAARADDVALMRSPAAQGKGDKKGRKRRRGAASTTPAPATLLPAPPLWSEFVFMTHLLALPLFLLWLPRISDDLANIPESQYAALLLSVVSQCACICGVQIISERYSAFATTLTVTLRKFITLTIATFLFGHYVHMTQWEWIAMITVAVSGFSYPFLP